MSNLLSPVQKTADISKLSPLDITWPWMQCLYYVKGVFVFYKKCQQVRLFTEEFAEIRLTKTKIARNFLEHIIEKLIWQIYTYRRGYDIVTCHRLIAKLSFRENRTLTIAYIGETVHINKKRYDCRIKF